jgi:hypothetical protein
MRRRVLALCKTHWETIPEQNLRLATHKYDGAPYTTPAEVSTCVKLSKSRIDSIIYELAVMTDQPDFFMNAPTGINCASGFIWFSEGNARPHIDPHSRDHNAAIRCLDAGKTAFPQRPHLDDALSIA